MHYGYSYLMVGFAFGIMILVCAAVAFGIVGRIIQENKERRAAREEWERIKEETDKNQRVALRDSLVRTDQLPMLLCKLGS